VPLAAALFETILFIISEQPLCCKWQYISATCFLLRAAEEIIREPTHASRSAITPALLGGGISDNKQHTRISVSQEWVFLLARFTKNLMQSAELTAML
jgi:hypothetical protein